MNNKLKSKRKYKMYFVAFLGEFMAFETKHAYIHCRQNCAPGASTPLRMSLIT